MRVTQTPIHAHTHRHTHWRETERRTHTIDRERGSSRDRKSETLREAVWGRVRKKSNQRCREKGHLRNDRCREGDRMPEGSGRAWPGDGELIEVVVFCYLRRPSKYL